MMRLTIGGIDWPVIEGSVRYLQKRDGRWLVKGPQGGVIMEYQNYSDAQYHVVYGKRPPVGLDTARHLRGLCRKQ